MRRHHRSFSSSSRYLVSGLGLAGILILSICCYGTVSSDVVQLSGRAANVVDSAQKLKGKVAHKMAAVYDRHLHWTSELVLKKMKTNDFEQHALEPEWRWAANVSIVYTWVNGSEPAYRKLRQEHGGASGSERDRDNDDLRFSLRALQQMIPWHTGQIFLVSPNGHIPDWLDTRNTRFQHIPQDSLLPKEDQPTFNSNVTEGYLHLIPGLSSPFIVMNDDYFIARPVHPSAFFTERRGVKLFLEPVETGLAGDRKGERQWERSLRHTAQIIEEAYGEIYHEKTRITEHAPFVFHRQAFIDMHHQNRVNQAIRLNGQHKFRHENDSIIPFLHNAYVIQEGSRCCGLDYEIVEGQSRFLEWSLDERLNRERWDELEKDKNVKFFSVNDAMGEGQSEDIVRAAQRTLRETLDRKYPERSAFELP